MHLGCFYRPRLLESIFHRLNPSFISNVFGDILSNVVAAWYNIYIWSEQHRSIDSKIFLVTIRIYLLLKFHKEMQYPYHTTVYGSLDARLLPRISESNLESQSDRTSQRGKDFGLSIPIFNHPCFIANGSALLIPRD